MKPLGMTVGFQVVRPTRAMDLIWEAVEAAVMERMTPTAFLREVEASWAQAYDDEKKAALEELRRRP